MFDVLTCRYAKCGAVYGLTSGFAQARREDHGTFYCPNGHRHSFPARSREEVLEEECDRLRTRLGVKLREADRLERSIRGHLGYEARLKNQIKAFADVNG